MGKVIGLGGVFIHLQGDTKTLYDWYEKHLGLSFSQYGSGFIQGQQLMVITFKRDDNPHMPYLNFRVNHIDELINHLKDEQVEILSDVTTYDYGKFATFMDPFGNPIELWEANEEAYIKLVEQEIEAYKLKRQPMV